MKQRTVDLMKRTISLTLSLLLCIILSVCINTSSRAMDILEESVLTAGYGTAGAVDADGNLWVWGDSRGNALGNNSAGDVENYNQYVNEYWYYQSIPVKILEDVRFVSMDGESGAAIKNDNSLWIWGSCGWDFGGGRKNDVPTPIKVMDGVRSVVVDGGIAFVKTDGSLWMCGANDRGQLGLGTQVTAVNGWEEMETYYKPQKVMDDVASISKGERVTAAITTDGTLWMWGLNEYGQLGFQGGNSNEQYDYDNRAQPEIGGPIQTTPIKIMDHVLSVSTDDYHTAAITEDGDLWMWGLCMDGEWDWMIGSGPKDLNKLVYGPIRVMEDVRAVSLGGWYIAAIKTDGTLWTWGHDYCNCLGLGIHDESPFIKMIIQTPSFVMADVACAATGHDFMAAVKEDGTLWTWGSDFYAQQGSGRKTNDVAWWGVDQVPAQTVPQKIMDGLAVPRSAQHTNLPEPSDPAAESSSPWAKDDVETAISLGLVPQSLQSAYTQAATRAEFCALAVALYEKANGEITQRSTFSDTADLNVEKMAALGVVNGVGDGKFSPDAKLTREQAATMLARLAGAMGKAIPTCDADFADADSISSWARDAVGQMQQSGVMNGVGDNRFSPAGEYTREQSIVTMLRMKRFLESE